MKRQLTCILCPRGCSLLVERTQEGAYGVTGNACPRGERYAIGEMTDPRRTVTSTLRVSNRTDVMVPVKTAAPVPKAAIFEVMAAVRAAQVEAPIAIGEVLLRDVCGTDIIATGAVS